MNSKQTTDRKRKKEISSDLQDGASPGFRIESKLLEKLSFPVLEDRRWSGRSTNRKHWDFKLRTDDGRSIACSKKDLRLFSEFFKCKFSNSADVEAGAGELKLRETSGSELEALLSIYYLKEKVRNASI